MRERPHFPALLAYGAGLLLLMACGSTPSGMDAGRMSAPDAGPMVVPQEGVLELGTGATSFEAVSDGDTLELARGIQGLQHIYVSLRVQDVNPELAITEVTLTRERDGFMVNEPFRVRLTYEVGTDGAEWVGAQLVGAQLVVPDEDAALGEPLILRARVEARDGAWAEAEAQIDIVPETEG